MSYLSPSDAAAHLGVSAKALRLWEEHGLITPGRTQAGWRAYGPSEMARAREIAALRALGFSLAQVGRALAGKAEGLEPALAAHQMTLESRQRELARQISQLRALRDALAAGRAPTAAELASLTPLTTLDLPWPWGGERFDLRACPLTWITGPLGSGKTKLAEAIARSLPGAAFIGLDRAPAPLNAAAEHALAWLIEDGATPSDALIALLAALATEGTGALVIDLIEQDLDEPTQHALAAWLRRTPAPRPLFAMTRSTAMLDLPAADPGEAIILCPANHSPPSYVEPWPGAPGYEALASCLASPDVRARTAGVIAWRPPAA